MNQQNKTERWEEILDNMFFFTDFMGVNWDFREGYNPNSIKKLISQLLSDARREERNRIKEALCGDDLTKLNKLLNE